MKKLICALLELAAALAVLAALCYAAITYWDKIMELAMKIRGKLPCRCRGDECCCDLSDLEDYADYEF